MLHFALLDDHQYRIRLYRRTHRHTTSAARLPRARELVFHLHGFDDHEGLACPTVSFGSTSTRTIWPGIGATIVRGPGARSVRVAATAAPPSTLVARRARRPRARSIRPGAIAECDGVTLRASPGMPMPRVSDFRLHGGRYRRRTHQHRPRHAGLPRRDSRIRPAIPAIHCSHLAPAAATWWRYSSRLEVPAQLSTLPVRPRRAAAPARAAPAPGHPVAAPRRPRPASSAPATTRSKTIYRGATARSCSRNVVWNARRRKTGCVEHPRKNGRLVRMPVI